MMLLFVSYLVCMQLKEIKNNWLKSALVHVLF